MTTNELNDRICNYRFPSPENTLRPDHIFSASAMHFLASAEWNIGLHDRSNHDIRVKWANSLHEVTAMRPHCPVNKVGTPVVSDIDVLLLSPFYRALAFALTVGIITKKEARETVEEYNKQ